MSCYVVAREAGPAWTGGGINAQPRLGDHTAFMNTLADGGIVLFAGPLSGTEQGRLRALLVFNADSDAEIHRRLADDPWADRLRITGIERWNMIVGAERLPTTETVATTAP